MDLSYMEIKVTCYIVLGPRHSRYSDYILLFINLTHYFKRPLKQQVAASFAIRHIYSIELLFLPTLLLFRSQLARQMNYFGIFNDINTHHIGLIINELNRIDNLITTVTYILF